MNCMFFLLFVLVFGVLLGFFVSGQVICYWVILVGSEMIILNIQICLGEGIVGSWIGVCDICNGLFGLFSVVNVSDESFQFYLMFIVSVVVLLIQYGVIGGYDFEWVFFCCSVGDVVYEMFFINGDDFYSGYYIGVDMVGNDIGLQDVYWIVWFNVLLCLINVEMGEIIMLIWKECQFFGLDIDLCGFQLVKVKNFVVVCVELYSVLLEVICYYLLMIFLQFYFYIQLVVYIVIKGLGLIVLIVGQVYVGGNWGGWYSNWLGVIGLYCYVILKCYFICVVMMVILYVQFLFIILVEIDSGGVCEVFFEFIFKCQSGMINGIGVGVMVLGICVFSGVLVVSLVLGLVDVSGGLFYLFFDCYGELGIVCGVGICIYCDGMLMMFLVNENFVGGSNVEVIGWYFVIGGVIQVNGGSGGIDLYCEIFCVCLEKFVFGSQFGVMVG